MFMAPFQLHRMVSVSQSRLDALEQACVDAANMPLRHSLAFNALNGFPVVLNRFTYWARRGRRPDNPTEVLNASQAVPLRFVGEQMQAFHAIAGTLYLPEDPSRWLPEMRRLVGRGAPCESADLHRCPASIANIAVKKSVVQGVLPQDGERFTLYAGRDAYEAVARDTHGLCGIYILSRDHAVGESGICHPNECLLRSLFNRQAPLPAIVGVVFSKKEGHILLKEGGECAKFGTRHAVVMSLADAEVSSAPDQEGIDGALEIIARDLCCGAVALESVPLREILELVGADSALNTFAKLVVRTLCLVPESVNVPDGPQNRLMKWCVDRFEGDFLLLCIKMMAGAGCEKEIDVDSNVNRCPYRQLDIFFAGLVDSGRFARFPDVLDKYVEDCTLCQYCPLTFLNLIYFFHGSDTYDDDVFGCLAHMFLPLDACECTPCVVRARFQGLLLAEGREIVLRRFLYIFYHVAEPKELPYSVEVATLFRFVLEHHAKLSSPCFAEKTPFAGHWVGGIAAWFELFARLFHIDHCEDD